MTCCTVNVPKEPIEAQTNRFRKYEAFLHSGHENPDHTVRYAISLPGIHCGVCIAAIEGGLEGKQGIVSARVNLTLKRLNLEIDDSADLADILETIENLDFEVYPIDMGDLVELENERQSTQLLKAMAVAGFAAMNIMLLSVSVWSGADNSTKDLFHIISAIIAVPVVIYSGQVFFRSAFGALRAGRLNMDVPISLAVLLALGMSIFETMSGGGQAYFDAATMLLFFLLIGRYLDQKMREKARNSVLALSNLAAKGANQVLPDCSLSYIPADEIEPGMLLRLRPGDRVPADGLIASGITELDRSHVTGESDPVEGKAGQTIEAGALNLTGVIDLKVNKSADQSFLAEIGRMLEAAEQGRGHYTRIADRMARIYAPAVHLLALITFLFWLWTTNGDWHASLTTAIAVLIITCPCALGLAVPVAHVVAASRLMREGILMRDGGALERLAEIQKAVFDKTGTLTTGTPKVTKMPTLDVSRQAALKTLAQNSNHPAARAVAAHLANVEPTPLGAISELPGFGIEGTWKGRRVRLGRETWANEIAGDTSKSSSSNLSFAIEREQLADIHMSEKIRHGARDAISQLNKFGIPSEILSGDSHDKVCAIASSVGVEKYSAEQLPNDKFNCMNRREQDGEYTLMVGDGINDATALAAAHVSMAPATAADVGRHAADFIFTRSSLAAVPFAFQMARRTRTIIKQNFGLALIYNLIAVPLAFAGYVTPLFAAIAMSASSILVVANAMRLQTSMRGQVSTVEKANRVVKHQREKVPV